MRGTGLRGRVAGVVALEVVAVCLVQRLAGPAVNVAHPLEWLRDVDAGDAVVALARTALAVGSWWLLGTTLVYFVARVTRAGWLAAATERLTLPVVRRVVDAALALTLVGGGLSARPAVATIAGRPTIAVAGQAGGPTRGGHAYVPVAAGDPRPGRRRREASAERPVPTPGRRSQASSPSTTPASLRPHPPDVVAASPALPGTPYEIVRGDNFWIIAARRVRAEDPSASSAELARYWIRLVDANRARIRSGDPNLIFPGERVVLPAIDS